jgi:hypothetical protein
MKIHSSKLVYVFVALALTAVTLSSCNRGYGCPYELKAPISVLK